MKYSRIPLLLFCAAVSLGVSLGLVGCGPAQESAPENVVLVVIDTLRRDHLATYGYPRQTAPFLDRLAREGAALDGLSPSSWTKPATASLLTGLHPLRHQAVGRLDALPDEAETLAERLRAQGYQTLGVSSNGWISEPFGFHQGFDPLLLLDSVGDAQVVNRDLLPLLDKVKPPFFLYVHYTDPHAPYEPRTAWDGGALPETLRAAGPVSIESLDAFTDRKRPADFMARVRDLYDGEIRSADRGLEELIGHLRKRGLMERTIVVVTSDHGEELEDHGRMSHGLSLYGEVVRVPLVLHAPHRIPAGRRGGPASLLDVVPTLEDFLDLPDGAEDLDGVSLAGLLRDGAWKGDEAGRPLLFHLDHMDGAGIALRQGSDKLVLGRRPYRKELFDLAADPAERRNRLPRGESETFEALAEDLAAMYNDYSRETFTRELADMDERLRGNMAALGYAAPERNDDPRRIPRRIVPADNFPEGLLGWEGAESLPACADLDDPAVERHLIRGWYYAEAGGRWTRPRALLALGVREKRPVLVVQGVSYRPDSPRLRASVGHHPVLEATVPAGAFRLTAELAGLSRGDLALVEIVTEPEFVPSRHGGMDQRSLGLFLTSVCLEPAA